jgi:hypothetical protein
MYGSLQVTVRIDLCRGVERGRQEIDLNLARFSPFPSRHQRGLWGRDSGDGVDHNYDHVDLLPALLFVQIATGLPLPREIRPRQLLELAVDSIRRCGGAPIDLSSFRDDLLDILVAPRFFDVIRHG